MALMDSGLVKHAFAPQTPRSALQNRLQMLIAASLAALTIVAVAATMMTTAL